MKLRSAEALCAGPLLASAQQRPSYSSRCSGCAAAAGACFMPAYAANGMLNNVVPTP